jgi:hypothetical protein
MVRLNFSYENTSSGCNRSLTSYFTFGIWLRVCRLASRYDEFSGRMNGIA